MFKKLVWLGLLLSLLLSHRLVYAQNCPRLCQAMTTAGDMIINNTRGESARLPVGSTDQILTVSSAGIPSWSSSIVSPTLTNPTVSGDLTFSTAAAKIIPGATSLTFRNNANDASNLVITDGGPITLRGNITGSFTSGQQILMTGTAGFWKIAGGATAAITDGGFINIYGNTHASIGSVQVFSGNAAGSLITNDLGSATSTWAVRNSSGGNFWSIAAADGVLTSSATNGGGITLAKTAANMTPIYTGLTSADADLTALTTTHAGMFVNQNRTIADSAVFVANAANTLAGVLSFFKTRATAPATDANTIVVSGDELGIIRFIGADGAAYRQGALIKALVDGTPGSSDMPGSLVFQTTPDGSTTTTTALTIENDQDLLITQRLTSSRSTDIGWSVVDQTDNQACNTGCTSACVFGIDNATGSAVTNLVSCAATTADLCVCAGAS